MIVLFHDAVTVALDGTHQKMIPFGPPSKFAEVFSSSYAKVFVCKPCAEIRFISDEIMVKNASFGGMNDLHQYVSRADSKFIRF